MTSINDVPPKRFNQKRVDSSLKAKLRKLQIGESVEGPRCWEKSAYDKAKSIGIKVTCRRIGSDDTVHVFRIE